MPKSLTVTPIKVNVGWQFRNSTNIGADVIQSYAVNYSKTLTDGTGSGSANQIYADKLTIAAGATTTLDFTGAGALTDIFGSAVAFARIKLLYLEHLTSAATAAVEIAGTWVSATSGTANFLILGGTTPTVKALLRPGWCLFLGGTEATAFPVANGTTDTITLKNTDAAPISLNVVVVGANA